MIGMKGWRVDHLNQAMEDAEIRISLGKITLEGHLVIPPKAQSIVIFAHGSGSSRFSPRNLFVSDSLQSEGLATLLCDLLTRREEEVDAYSGSLRFDIGLLANRLSGTTATKSGIKQTRTRSSHFLPNGKYPVNITFH